MDMWSPLTQAKYFKVMTTNWATTLKLPESLNKCKA